MSAVWPLQELDSSQDSIWQRLPFLILAREQVILQFLPPIRRDAIIANGPLLRLVRCPYREFPLPPGKLHNLLPRAFRSRLRLVHLSDLPGVDVESVLLSPLFSDFSLFFEVESAELED